MANYALFWCFSGCLIGNSLWTLTENPKIQAECPFDPKMTPNLAKFSVFWAFSSQIPRITLSPPGSESTLRFPRSPRDTTHSVSRSSHPITFHFIYPIRIISIVRHGASSSTELNLNSVIRKYLWHIGVIESSRPESNYFSVITGS